jgi:hypothetical protein
MEHPSSGRYRSSLDGNMDYLLTSLQLDMIGIAASDYSETSEEPSGDDPIPDPAEPEHREDLS